MKFQIGTMTVGDILDRGLKLLLSRFGAFVGIQFFAFLPILVVLMLGLFLVETAPMLAVVFGLLAIVLALFLQPVASGAVLKVIAEEYVDRKISAGAAMGFAMTRFGPLLLTSIMTGLVVLLGLLLLIVPGIMWFMSYAFVGQVVVLEQLSGGDAMSRSASLTSGHRWRIFGLVLLIGILQLIAHGAVNLLDHVIPRYVYEQTRLGLTAVAINPGNFAIHTAINWVADVILGSYGAVCMTLMYFDLRVRKEGYDLEVASQSGTTPAETR
jgi:hypothetical protein